MKKLTAILVAIAFVVPFVSYGASVTTDSVPTTCSSAVLRGTASYTAPETLRISLNGSVVGTFTSGEATWQVTSSGPFKAENTVTAEVLNAASAVIATASTTFRADCGSINPMAVMQSWGLTGFQTPWIKAGTTIFDKFNNKGLCELWSGPSGCFNISATAYYLKQFIAR